MKKEKRKYGVIPSEEREENTELCISSVCPSEGFGAFHQHQCSRKRGFGKDGLYCKQHAKNNPQT